MRVRGKQCPYDPKPLLGQPIGMFHCPACGCMVVAGIEHGPCYPNLCPALDSQGDNADERMPHPGEVILIEVTDQDVEMLGLTPIEEAG